MCHLENYQCINTVDPLIHFFMSVFLYSTAMDSIYSFEYSNLNNTILRMTQ